MRRRALLSALLVLSTWTHTATGSQPAAGAAVPIYDSTQVALDRYTVLKRIGIDDWRSAFGIRGHSDLAGAQSAIVSEAGRLGADGVINLTCFDQTDRVFNPAGYFCYGNAIRMKK